MREIKFRAWNEKPWDTGGPWKCSEHPEKEHPHDNCPGPGVPNKTGNMVYPYEGSMGFQGLYSGDILKSYDIVMQYTGLKDKNGKEIYEGDICQDSEPGFEHEDIIFEVKWDVCGFSPFCEETSFYESGKDDMIEVIGNVYENSELLKQIETT